MTLSTWQLIVVGALATIWAVVLGVPLLADLLRWLRNRPPAPRTDRRRSRRNVVESMEYWWWNRPRPVLAWRSQDVVRRRVQILLACGIASTVAMFLAIALRGLFVPLFALMMAVSLLVLAIGAFIGAHEHRHLLSLQEIRSKNRHGTSRTPFAVSSASAVDAAEVNEEILVGGEYVAEPIINLAENDAPTSNPWQTPDGEYTIPTIAEIAEAFRTPDRDGFMFEPLNLEEEVLSRQSNEGGTDALDGSDIEIPVDPAVVAELGLDLDGVPDVRFQAAPEAGNRQASARARRKKRSKARPIYIESVLDEDGNPGKAMND